MTGTASFSQGGTRQVAGSVSSFGVVGTCKIDASLRAARALLLVLLRKVLGGDERVGQGSITRLLARGLSAYAHAVRALPGPLLRNVEGLLDVGDAS